MGIHRLCLRTSFLCLSSAELNTSHMCVIKLNCTVFYVLLLFFVDYLQAQPDPITIQFVEAQPLWEHLAWDPNFPSNDTTSDINKYTTLDPHIGTRIGSDYYALHRGTSPAPQTYGYVLEKLDVQTGSLAWKINSTYYNGGLQDFYKAIHRRADGEIEMTGIMRSGEYLNDIPLAWEWGHGSSKSIRKVINESSGELIEAIISRDSITNIGPLMQNYFSILEDSLYIQTNMEEWTMNGEYSYGLVFYLRDKYNNLLDSLPVARVRFDDPNISVRPFSYGQPQYIQRLGKDTLVCLLYKDKFYPDSSQAQIVWLDISDVWDIKEISRVRIPHQYLKEQREYNYVQFGVTSGFVYLMDVYRVPDTGEDATYIISYAHEGTFISGLPIMDYGGQFYLYMHNMYSGDDHLYFAARPSYTGRKGFDIVKYTPKNQQVQYINSLTSALPDEEFDRGMDVCQLYNDHLLIIGAYTKKVGPVQNSAIKFYAFDARDLGINLATSVAPVLEQERILLFPTLTQGCFTIKDLPHSYDHVIIKVYDLNGMCIVNSVGMENESICIEGEHPPGLYLVSIRTRDGMVLGNFKIMLQAD